MVCWQLEKWREEILQQLQCARSQSVRYRYSSATRRRVKMYGSLRHDATVETSELNERADVGRCKRFDVCICRRGASE